MFGFLYTGCVLWQFIHLSSSITNAFQQIVAENVMLMLMCIMCLSKHPSWNAAHRAGSARFFGLSFERIDLRTALKAVNIFFDWLYIWNLPDTTITSVGAGDCQRCVCPTTAAVLDSVTSLGCAFFYQTVVHRSGSIYVERHLVMLEHIFCCDSASPSDNSRFCRTVFQESCAVEVL